MLLTEGWTTHSDSEERVRKACFKDSLYCQKSKGFLQRWGKLWEQRSVSDGWRKKGLTGTSFLFACKAVNSWSCYFFSLQG